MLHERAARRAILEGMASPDGVSILIIEDDKASQSALQQVLDSEGWRVRIASTEDQALHELAAGRWALIVANAAMTGVTGPLYTMLMELASAPMLDSGKARLRILFLVPELCVVEARRTLEQARVPYVLKPYHFHDFLEKVSDLLLETEAISAPIRRVRLESQPAGRRKQRGTSRQMSASQASGQAAGQSTVRNTGMFANRDYYDMTEEEIAEYERQEAEETQRKKKKKLETAGP